MILCHSSGWILLCKFLYKNIAGYSKDAVFVSYAISRYFTINSIINWIQLIDLKNNKILWNKQQKILFHNDYVKKTLRSNGTLFSSFILQVLMIMHSFSIMWEKWKFMYIEFNYKINKYNAILLYKVNVWIIQFYFPKLS